MAGLSILIPIFNRDVSELVHALLAQLPDWPGPTEIRLLDDGSDEKYRVANRLLATLPRVVYQELAANVGRATVRNQLVAKAKYEWVLLLDNTGQVTASHYLARYAAASSQAPVVAGGVRYADQAPAEPGLRLRWLYGRQREARPLAQRKAAAYDQLLINNLLIQKALLQQFPLDERLRGYGHEDTKLGWQLAAAGVPIHHLDNPIMHAGLETATAFLEKSEQAVRNLAQLLRQDNLGASSRLVQAARRLQRARLAAALQAALTLGEPLLRRNLLSTRPSLKALDALKLLWLLREGGGR
ncbi:glycosyltransferase family 2 protein [Hymenobacter setariae]|uniref:Glycosyltransferase family 2 protein n=1 Tax=Hymenobacter setariae TaxID=2594794 RepID=A0A558C2Q1_9BACT|nr:glycosyltransferase [Hymenobacter setariae]TVT43058.1 glycosyltransferase family 2 protein [Hymenobacter setariae]